MLADVTADPVLAQISDHAETKLTSAGSSEEASKRKSRNPANDIGVHKPKVSNGTDRKPGGFSRRSSVSILSRMKTYREHAGSKIVAISIMAQQAKLGDLFRYLMFLILFVLIVFLRAPQNESSFWNQALRARFTPSVFNLDDVQMSHTNFNNVTSKAVFWLYMYNVLSSALQSEDDSNMLMRNSILGGIQLRQIPAMVREDSLHTYQRSQIVPNPPYNSFVPMGMLSLIFVRFDKPRLAFNFQFHFGMISGFIDEHTRAMFVDFTLQNPTTSYLCMARLLFEMLPYGGIRPSSYFRVTDVKLYDTIPDQIVSGIEAIFVVLFLRIGLLTWKEMRGGYVVFFSTFWGIIDFLNVLMFALIIVMIIIFRLSVGALCSRLNSEPYVDFQSAAYTNNQIYNLSAFNAVLSWIRVLKYLRLSRRLSMLERVFTNVRHELFAWMLLFAVIFAGFSQGFCLAFRGALSKYQNVFAAMTTLFQGVYGDIEIQSLQAAATFLGPMLFTLYIFVVCFLMMSMFLAILQGAWMKTEEDACEDEKDDLAAALQFAIKNAKDNAKRQGFKLRNLMARPSMGVDSPQFDLNSGLQAQASPRNKSSETSMWTSFKRSATMQSLSLYRQNNNVPHPAHVVAYNVSPRSQIPARSPRLAVDSSLSLSPRKPFLEAPSAQVGVQRDSLVAQSHLSSSQQSDLSMGISNGRSPRKSVLLTPRQVQILTDTVKALEELNNE